MEPGRRARGVGQLRLEEPPASPTADEAPPPARPAEPLVPPDGSSAELRRRQTRWFEERARFERARAEGQPPPAE